MVKYKQELKEETSVQDEKESVISKDNSEAYSELQKELEDELQKSVEKPDELEKKYTDEKEYRNESRDYEYRRPYESRPYKPRYQPYYRSNAGSTLRETRAITTVLNTVYEQLSKLQESGEPTEAYETLRKTARILSEFSTKKTHAL